jgi:hypothetical protein
MSKAHRTTSHWLVLLPLLAICATPGCDGSGSSAPNACKGVRAVTDTVTGSLFVQAKGLPASPLPDVVSDAVKLRATVVQAMSQIEATSLQGHLRTELNPLAQDLDKAKRYLDQYISGIRQNGVGGYRGPSADTIEKVLIDADHVGDQLSRSCGA